MKQPTIFVDERSCWGCMTCVIACKQENKTPDGINFVRITEEWSAGRNGDPLGFKYSVNRCRHCKDPACATACPTGAISKRTDGIVFLDVGLCGGCGACVQACIYGAISFDGSRGIARKCNLCSHRIEAGLIPACADNVCLSHSIYFGDAEEVRHAAEKKLWLATRISRNRTRK